ncbi:MAG TPA: efflux RND transporter permease subunit, partial [Methylomirabilota bacterium]|nr:efflux RND transporter permease subunit [Methylomirabilota bacterium]
MKGLNAWFVTNPVAANLVVLVILVAGVLAPFRLKQEIFPEFSADQISVSVVYPGAAPEEVEEGVCLRVEEAVFGLEGIKRITSTAAEGAGAINIEALPGADARKLLDDIKSRVDAIDTFPVETEKPVVKELVIRNQVINIGISGAADEKTLRHVGERVRDEVSSIPGITQAELVSVRPYEISIELSESALRQYGLTFDEVARAVRRTSLDLPGGSVKTDAGEVLLRVKGQAYNDFDFSRLIIRTMPDGSRVRLGDVAIVRDAFEDQDQRTLLDGAPSVMVQVFRVGDQNALDIARKVHEYIESVTWLPDGIKIVPWQDYAKYLQGRIDLLTEDTVVGFILVFIVLALFLKFKLAFWVSFGIPIAFLGALALMPTLDVSISMISLFAFIIVLGIVVDDAIVIGENIYTKHQQGLSGVEAAIKGTQEVMTPVTFGVLTTVAAFLPMLFVGGNTGKVMRVIPLIVIPTLLISLLEGLLCLPAHLRNLDKGSRNPQGIAVRWARIQEWFAGKLQRFVERVYTPLLDRVLRWRYVSVAAAAAIFLITVGLVAGGRIKFTFFPHVEGDDIAAMVTMPLGAPTEATAAAVAQLERAAEQLRKEYDGKGVVEDGKSIIRHLLSS